MCRPWADGGTELRKMVGHPAAACGLMSVRSRPTSRYPDQAQSSCKPPSLDPSAWPSDQCTHAGAEPTAYVHDRSILCKCALGKGPAAHRAWSARARARACSEAAHDGPVTNRICNRTIVCGLAVGALSASVTCTSATSAGVRPAAGCLPRMARGARRAPSSPRLVAFATTLSPY